VAIFYQVSINGVSGELGVLFAGTKYRYCPVELGRQVLQSSGRFWLARSLSGQPGLVSRPNGLFKLFLTKNNLNRPFAAQIDFGMAAFCLDRFFMHGTTPH